MTLEEVERLISSSPDKEVKAHFESVERGTKLQSYDIILRGVHREPGLKVIMFITSQKIVAGMSGSPVYVDGKLIGALAYSFNRLNFADWSWGGISPISLMLEEADKGSSLLNVSSVPTSFISEGRKYEPIDTGYHKISNHESLSNSKFILNSVLQNSKVSKAPVLKAGMPIVADLIEWTDEKGEITTVSAMGTITYVDDNGRVFAFGHPFLGARKVVYSFRTAEVMGTVFSEGGSYKLTGDKSEVLGSITFDSTYGIYGSIGSGQLDKLHQFDLEFRSGGKHLQDFKIKVADSFMTPLLAQSAFRLIGQANNAPLPQESSVTEIATRVDLQNGYKPVIWEELFASKSTKFGIQTLYTSSYDAAYEYFFSEIYSQLFENKYNINIEKVSVSVNFIPGKNSVFKLGAYKFPNKVVWGENPVLEVLFISQDNVTAIAKKATIQIDWSQVQKPVFTKDTPDIDKTSEKIVRGILSISSSFSFLNNLTSSESQALMPQYFLGAGDFLENLSRRLGINNQKVFVRFVMKARSGLFDDQIANAKDIMPQDISGETSGWHTIDGGMKERKVTVKNEGVVVFYLDLPQVPDGYVVDQNLNEVVFFEIVLN